MMLKPKHDRTDHERMKKEERSKEYKEKMLIDRAVRNKMKKSLEEYGKQKAP